MVLKNLATKFYFLEIIVTHQNDVDGRGGGLEKQTVPLNESQKKKEQKISDEGAETKRGENYK